ncbi:MAG: cytochrome b5 domain-containing protein [Gammaproteobacteria bacterium]|nr:cytochrome b5 domain-containing protein [Gammaproteobacteria bacterium]
MKRFVFAAWSAFIGAVAALTWVAIAADPSTTETGTEQAAESTFTLEEVAAHDSAADCWVAIDDGVYELTDYLSQHPTPIEEHCGTEASEGMHTKGVGRPHSDRAWQQLAGYRIGSLAAAPASNDTDPESEADTEAAAPQSQETAYTGSESCMGCHRGIHDAYSGNLHPRMLGPASEINDELLEKWAELPDPQGNPVVFDENQASGIDGTRDIELKDGTRLDGIASVHVDHQGERRFTARFLDADGAVRREQAATLYHIGARYRQALAVNLGDGAGTRLLKYQYSFDDGRYQYTWNDRNQARIYEKNCIGCHVSGFDLAAFEADPDQSLEQVTADLGVGCESCHGPGGDHVAAPSEPGAIVNPAALTKDQQVHVCAQCHIRGTSTAHDGRQDNINFLPGDNVLADFDSVPVEWGARTRRVAADGKAAASRQQFMDHYLGTKSNLSCTACHSVHDDDSQGKLLSGDLVQACAGCHGAKAFPDLDAVRAAMNGLRGWDDDSPWRGWRSQHTFRLDDEGRLTGLPESEWPEEGGWPWEQPDWQWDFSR